MFIELGLENEKELINFNYVKEFWYYDNYISVTYSDIEDDLNHFEYHSESQAKKSKEIT